MREERYELFRGYFHGATDAADAAENLQARLHTVVLPDVLRRSAAARARSSSRGESKSPAFAGAARGPVRPPDWRFEAGDVVVLLGRLEALSTSRAQAVARPRQEGIRRK